MPRASIPARCRRRPPKRRNSLQQDSISKAAPRCAAFFIGHRSSRQSAIAVDAVRTRYPAHATMEISHENRSFGKDGAGDGLDLRHRPRHRQGTCRGRRDRHGQWPDPGQGRCRGRRDRQGRARQQGPRRRRRCLDGGRMQDAGRRAAGGRHPDQQCRDFRTQGILRYSRRGLEPLLRGQCDVGRAAVARLSAGHAEAQLGPHRLHLLRIRAEYPEGNDPLRHDQDRATGGVARPCRDDPRHRRDRQFGAAGADDVGGRGNLRQGSRQAKRPVGGGGGVGIRQAVSSDLAAAALCQRRGDRQHGGLCQLEGGLGDQRRGASRRRRHRPDCIARERRVQFDLRQHRAKRLSGRRGQCEGGEAIVVESLDGGS